VKEEERLFDRIVKPTEGEILIEEKIDIEEVY